MKLKLTCLAVALTLASSSLFAAEPKALGKVNGVPISAAVGDLMANEQIAQGAPNDEALRRAIKEELVRREVLAQEAKKRGLDKKSDIQVRVEMARQGILIASYINEWAVANPISDAQMRSEYERRVADMSSTEHKVRHIQTLTEADAQAVIAKLQSGAKFADLAKDSVDAGSKDNGGDIGWVSPKGLPQPFGDAVTKLEKGKFTTVPVQTTYGFHVIMLDETRKAVPPTFEEKKNELRQYLEQQALNAHIKTLLAKSKVE
ncbi:peptidylprolyl isomerase [Uliginosibacterium flavum]|uniref:peptidylprolyl isomerase n=1 Tax=Uliginosibacterium flavum TaxID=1396831 RepID=A0ABV2TNR9_9RHOO